MVTWKGLAWKTRVAILIAAISACPSPSSALDRQWQTLTSFKEVRRMCQIGDTLFLATSGGLLAISDVNTPGVPYTNVDGLGTTDITDILADADGCKWVTGLGRLVRINGGDFTVFLFSDDNDDLIGLHRVIDDGDNLWVGAEIGLVLFSKTVDGGQIQDSYGRFGDLPDFPTVYDIALDGDSIWLATSAGLAVADRTDPVLLKSPTRWTVLTSDALMGATAVTRVVLLEGGAYMATDNGLLRLDRATSEVEVLIGTGLTIADLALENDTLFFWYNGGMGYIAEDAPVLLPVAGLPSAPITGSNNGSFRWVAVATGGVYHNLSGEYVEYPYTGLPGNYVSDITVSAGGVLTAAFTEKPAARFADGLWESYDYWVRGGTTDMMTDSAGNTWSGTVGNGLWLLRDEGLSNYDETNSSMRGNTDNPPVGETYVIILGLDTDGDYLYAACYRALNMYPIAIADMRAGDTLVRWDSLGVVDGITTEFVVSLDHHGGFLAVGADRDPGGVFVCNLGEDPFNRDPYSCLHYTETNSFLLSNVVRVVRFSPGGVLWVGCNNGLSRYDMGYERFVDVDLPPGVGHDVLDLEFDSRGNLWIGTSSGLARLDASTGASEAFTTSNSGLVAERIGSLHSDPFTDNLYVATNSGISILPSPIGPPSFAIEQVVAIPNPFVIRCDDDRLRFNYARKVAVRIYSVAGELVRETDTNTPWDGRNQKGEKTASGVYIFVLSDGSGEVGRGKLLLVRE